MLRSHVVFVEGDAVEDAEHTAPHEWQWRERSLSEMGASASASAATLESASSPGGKKHVRSWPVDRVTEVHFMRYLLQNIAVSTP